MTSPYVTDSSLKAQLVAMPPADAIAHCQWRARYFAAKARDLMIDAGNTAKLGLWPLYTEYRSEVASAERIAVELERRQRKLQAP